MSKGAAFERVCRDELHACGWHAIRAAGSKGAADLWAARSEAGRTRLLVVQVKSGVQRMRPAEWNELLLLAEMTGATPVLAVKVPRVRRPQWWRLTAAKSGRLGQREPKALFDIEAWHDDTVAA